MIFLITIVLTFISSCSSQIMSCSVSETIIIKYKNPERNCDIQVIDEDLIIGKGDVERSLILIEHKDSVKSNFTMMIDKSMSMNGLIDEAWFKNCKSRAKSEVSLKFLIEDSIIIEGSMSIMWTSFGKYSNLKVGLMNLLKDPFDEYIFYTDGVDNVDEVDNSDVMKKCSEKKVTICTPNGINNVFGIPTITCTYKDLNSLCDKIINYEKSKIHDYCEISFKNFKKRNKLRNLKIMSKKTKSELVSLNYNSEESTKDCEIKKGILDIF